MMFKILDERIHEAFSGLALAQVSKWKKNEWKCITKDEFFMEVKIEGSVVHMKLAEAEQELFDYDNEVLEININNKDINISSFPFLTQIMDIKFKDIMEFMGWTCDEEQMWDD